MYNPSKPGAASTPLWIIAGAVAILAALFLAAAVGCLGLVTAYAVVADQRQHNIEQREPWRKYEK